MIYKSDHSSIKNDTLSYSCWTQKQITPRGRERTQLQNDIKAKSEHLKLNKNDRQRGRKQPTPIMQGFMW
jgi:hypothetical protein